MIEPAVELCVLLWAHPGRVGDLVAYEDHVLQLLAVHGATLVTRVRTVEPSEDGLSEDGPTEVQVIRFGSSAGFDAYMADPARAAMADRRDEAVDRTEVHRVTVVG